MNRRTGGFVLFEDDLLVHGDFSVLFAGVMHSLENMSRTEIEKERKKQSSIGLYVIMNLNRLNYTLFKSMYAEKFIT